MPIEESISMTHQEWLQTWKLLHADTWRKYDGAANEKILLDGALQYRACQTAFDRSFHQNKSALVRTDGKTPQDDAREAAEREAAENAELESNVTVSKDDYNFAASLSPAQLAETYRADPSFARKYRKLIKDFGFRDVPVFAARGMAR